MAGVEPELPGVVDAELLPVFPPVDGVAGVDGVDPELPGVAAPELLPVVPPVEGVAGLEAVEGTATAVAFTGVVATVTKVTTATFLAAAGVDPDFPGDAAALLEPPLEPEEFEVHWATQVSALDGMVKFEPAD